jgi:hypothetical protein
MAKRKTNVAAKAKAKKTGKKKGDVSSVIKKLKIDSLHEDDIKDVMLHCASVLNVRRNMANREASAAGSSASSCYTKSGSSSTVSLWSGGFKVGETTEADAQAQGIPPCG